MTEKIFTKEKNALLANLCIVIHSLTLGFTEESSWSVFSIRYDFNVI